MLCLLGPYGDFFIEVLAEILTRFPQVDAFSFDGLHYGGVCYCENCRVIESRGASRSGGIAGFLQYCTFRDFLHSHAARLSRRSATA